MKVLCLAICLLGTAATVHAQDAGFVSSAGTSSVNSGAISTARDLYAAARYDEALALLNRMSPNEAQPTERRTIEQYRALCLLALGRTQDAEGAIAAVVTADPFYRPAETETSPRVRTTFADVRGRLLPDVATTWYATAKRAYDAKEFADAERQFRQLLALLNDPQMQGRMADLRTLTAGFVELATAAAAPPPAPKEVEPPTPAPEPPAPAAPRTYTSDDAGVVPPGVIRQEVPPVPASLITLARDRGVLELVIDEEGRVTAMALRMRIHPMYDNLLLNAAKDWRYRPATLNGKPVRFRKLLQVSVAKR